MKFFYKYLAVFIGLTVLLVLGDTLLFKTSLPFSGTFLFSNFASLILTLLYGWIDSVYIQKQQA